jgi:DnaK suppressor protein
MDTDEAAELLTAERARLEKAIASATGGEHENDTQESEPGELGSQELLRKELDSGLAEDLGAQLASVERAEQRLAAGRYGLSVDSGDAIPDARLRAMPAAERTVAEQETLDRG